MSVPQMRPTFMLETDRSVQEVMFCVPKKSVNDQDR